MRRIHLHTELLSRMALAALSLRGVIQARGDNAQALADLRACVALARRACLCGDVYPLQAACSAVAQDHPDAHEAMFCVVTLARQLVTRPGWRERATAAVRETIFERTPAELAKKGKARTAVNA